jgi:phage repressor protein C with HTH and peptisase S24 domain
VFNETCMCFVGCFHWKGKSKVDQAHREQQIRRALGRRLILVRGRITQDAYAAQLGVHVNTLARYERGERLPGADFLQRLGANGVNLHWLLTGQTTHAQAAVQIGEPQSVYAIQSFARVRASSGITADANQCNQSQNHQTQSHQARSQQAQAGSSASILRKSQHRSATPTQHSSDRPHHRLGIDETLAQQTQASDEDLADFLKQGSVLFFDPKWLQRNWGVDCDEVCLVCVEGDSMEPVLKAGDQVLVKRSCRCVVHDGLYLLALGESLLVRRLQCLPGYRYRVMSANPAYASFIVSTVDRAADCSGNTSAQEAESIVPPACHDNEQEFELDPLPLGMHSETHSAWQNSVMALGATLDHIYLKARSEGGHLRVLGRVLWVGQSV